MDNKETAGTSEQDRIAAEKAAAKASSVEPKTAADLAADERKVADAQASKNNATADTEARARAAMANPATAEAENRARALSQDGGDRVHGGLPGSRNDLPAGRVNDPLSPEAIEDQHRLVDEFNGRRNEENQEGHEKNVERAQRDAELAHARTKDGRVDLGTHLPPHVPTGKEMNRNTPRVLPDGSKVWDQ